MTTDNSPWPVLSTPNGVTELAGFDTITAFSTAAMVSKALNAPVDLTYTDSFTGNRTTVRYVKER